MEGRQAGLGILRIFRGRGRRKEGKEELLMSFLLFCLLEGRLDLDVMKVFSSDTSVYPWTAWLGEGGRKPWNFSITARLPLLVHSVQLTLLDK